MIQDSEGKTLANQSELTHQTQQHIQASGHNDAEFHTKPEDSALSVTTKHRGEQ